jgi:hypothetical protein
MPMRLRRKCVRWFIGFASNRRICSLISSWLSSFSASSCSARAGFFLAEGFLEDIENGPVTRPSGGALARNYIGEPGNLQSFPRHPDFDGAAANAVERLGAVNSSHEINLYIVVITQKPNKIRSRIFRAEKHGAQ